MTPSLIHNELQFQEHSYERFPHQQSSLSAKLLERSFRIGDWIDWTGWRLASQTIAGSGSGRDLFDPRLDTER